MKKTMYWMLIFILSACQNQTNQAVIVNTPPIEKTENQSVSDQIQTYTLTYPHFTQGESLLHALPADLSTIIDESPALGYTLTRGIGIAGNSTLIYTPEQLELIRQSPWVIENFHADDLFPIYRKTAFSEAMMRELGNKILTAFNVTEEEADITYYEPVDFRAEDFVLDKSNRKESSQAELYVSSDPISFRIYQHGTICLYLNFEYPPTIKTPYTQVGTFKNLDPNGNHEEYRTFFMQMIEAAMKGGMEQFFPFKDPQLVLSEANALSANIAITLEMNNELYEQTDKTLTLPQQLFQTAYQNLSFSFTSYSLNDLTYTPIYGEKIADVKLISVDEAIEQYNSMIAIPTVINDIQAVTVGYNTDDYLYDTIPVYTIYYQETLESGEKRTISTIIPAVSLDPTLTYVAPMIAFELHENPWAK